MVSGPVLQGSSMSLSRSNSREHLGSASDSDNWRDHNSIGPTAPSDFVSSIGSPKRKQKSGNGTFEHDFSSAVMLAWDKKLFPL